MSDWAYAKAKDLSDRGWLGEAEFEEEQEDHIFTVAQALRDARAEGMRGAAKVCDGAEAQHLKGADPTSAAVAGQCAAMIREYAGEVGVDGKA